MPAAPLTSAPAPAIRELWSHDFLDALALEQFKETACRISADPALIEFALANIRRWVAKSGYHPGEIRSLREWEALLQRNDLSLLLRVMTDPGEDATRLRQSSPFAGILSADERERIIDRVTGEWTSNES
jgi:hypothetical protein